MTAYVELKRADSSSQRFAFATNVTVNKGDVVRVVTGTGGGYGNFLGRAPHAMADDVKGGYLTVERAKKIYGYVGLKPI